MKIQTLRVEIAGILPNRKIPVLNLPVAVPGRRGTASAFKKNMTVINDAFNKFIPTGLTPVSLLSCLTFL
jgi:hypothetical protein